MKKILALTLVLVTVLSVFAGCAKEESDAIVSAVDAVLEAGCRTADLSHGATALGTVEMTDRIIEALVG